MHPDPARPTRTLRFPASTPVPTSTSRPSWTPTPTTDADTDADDAPVVPQSDPFDPFAAPSAPRPRRRRAARRPTGAASTAVTPDVEPVPVPAASGPEAPVDDERPVSEVAAEFALGGGNETESGTSTAPASDLPADDAPPPPRRRAARRAAAPPTLTFQAPDLSELPARPAPADTDDARSSDDAEDDQDGRSGPSSDADDESDGGRSRRRRRGRRGRGKPRDEDEGNETASGDGDSAGTEPAEKSDAADKSDSSGGGDGDSDDSSEGSSGSKRRRRRRRRGEGDGDEGSSSASESSSSSSAEDEIKGVTGSTRLEAKRQRRRDNRDQSRRRVPIVTEAEYLARREAVERVMVVRNAGDRTQIAVLEDDVLVEHYVTRASSTSYAGNVYLGKVQNVLPSMEAAFVDIGKGRNGVLYAGEVNYDASGLEGKPRKIEQALKSGQSVVVQVTKDPIGHKGARLTSQISLPGRYMVYVPEGGSAGISRKLPDTERARLRSILKKVTPEDAGVIVRTAAEGASEEELTRDISRLATQWEQIQKKAAKASAPSLLSAEPDLVVRVVRDIFNEDFRELVVQGETEWETIQSYVAQVAPDLAPRLRKHIDSEDVFDAHRIDEQLLKALDRKVFLPSGGSLVFDRTEAMTVVDVNTGKFTGKGGNLEETVTRNNLEAAEELVRQLRLRDIGGIIVTDFIDMVLESNRELVLRRLTECLGRDRTKHQVAEVTSLGLVQMTRKRVGQGLLEAYSEPCPHCAGKGVLIELPSAGASSVAKPAGKPIPRPPTATRPILQAEPKAATDESADVVAVDAASSSLPEVVPASADEAVAEIPNAGDAAVPESANGEVDAETAAELTEPSAAGIEVPDLSAEAASAETPTDPDVEADAPAQRQIAAAETGDELPSENGDEPASAAPSPRPRRTARRRVSRAAPTTAAVDTHGSPSGTDAPPTEGSGA